MDLGEQMNLLARKFPKEETYNLSSSIESILQSGAEFRKFLGYAIRSLAEVVTCLHKAKRRKYVSKEEFTIFYKNCFDLMNMTIAFRNKIRN